MRLFHAAAIVIALSSTAFAVTGNQVIYVGGSVAGSKPGDSGTFDVSAAKQMVFVGTNGKVAIEYEKIRSIKYRNQLTRHLGVAPTIAVGLLRHRERTHLFTLTYVDETGVMQAAVFEVAKEAPQTLIAVFAARVPTMHVETSVERPFESR